MVNSCEQSRQRGSRRRRTESSAVGNGPFVTGRNHGTDNLGLVSGSRDLTAMRMCSQSQSGHYQSEDSSSGASPPASTGLVCAFSLFLPSFCLFSASPSSSSRVSAHVVLPTVWILWIHAVWDDTYVLSRTSLVSAFCRDRRGSLEDSEKELRPVVNRPFLSVHERKGFHIRVTYHNSKDTGNALHMRDARYHL